MTNEVAEAAVQKAMANASDIRVHNVQPEGLLQGKENGSMINASYPVPFFPSFLENLGPLYRAGSPDHRSKKASDVSLASGRPTEAHELEWPSDSTDGDAVRVALTFTEDPKLGSFLMTAYADSVVSSPDSSTRGADHLIQAGSAVRSPDSSTRGVDHLVGSEFSESDEVTSTQKPLTTTSSTPDLNFVPSTSSKLKGHVVRSPPANIVSSTRNTQDNSWHPGLLHQSGHRLPSRDSKGKQKAPEDGSDGSPSYSSSSKRSRKLRPDTKRLVPVTIASPILESRLRNPSCSQRDTDEAMSHADRLAGITGGFNSVKHSRYEEQCERAARRAEGFHRMRMRTLPEKSIWKTNEATNITLATLHQWQILLGLDNPVCQTVASQIFFRGIRKFQKSEWPIEIRDIQNRVRVLLAAAFWVAVKAIDTSSKVPRASRLALAADIDVQSLTRAELPLLDAIQWKLLCHSRRH